MGKSWNCEREVIVAGMNLGLHETREVGVQYQLSKKPLGYIEIRYDRYS